MAGETVLVVDDAPVNLKLTDILLRKEGYKVHTAADAEEALKLLRSFRPDLMLVDIRMPGMDGLELTRRLKRNPLTRDIVVVALTACAMKEDEQNAIAAGCSGFITKPIDTHTLGNRVRRHLDGRAAAPPAPSEGAKPGNGQRPEAAERGGLAFSDPELEGLRRRFLEEGILQGRQMLEGAGSNFDAAKTAGLLHTWIGTAGILGYTAISEMARRTEELVLSDHAGADQLQAAFTDLVFAFSAPREAAPAPMPAFILETLSGKAIALVGFAIEEGERLCAALEGAGARPRSFELADLPESGAVLDCSVLLFHVREETMSAWWISPGPKPPPDMPLILVGRRERILAVDRSVLARARDFLIDGWQPEEALMRLSFVLSRAVPAAAPPPPAARAAPRQPEILIADDDPVVISSVRTTLEDYGMKCMVASNGPTALQMIRDYRPHAAVLDLNMPGMDGYLVLAAIREESLPVRVLLLSARRHENDISRAFTLGADDYIVKPFNQVELVARLKRLLRN